MEMQKTIKKEVVFEGTGIHTGTHSVMSLKPAPRDTGIVFYRPDMDTYIKASVNAVTDTAFATTISSGRAQIKTVEHIMAAVSGLGIDNLLIEVKGTEIPIMDGSAAVFVDGIRDAGLSVQSSNRPMLKVVKPVYFKDGNSEITLLPYNGRRITYQIRFEHKFLGLQKLSVDLDGVEFAQEVAPARTFGFLKDVDALRQMGLGLGGSLENAIILNDEGVMNPSGLRFSDEFIRHKVLDFIGDMALGGLPIIGHFVVNRSGHTANAKFLKKFLSNPDCWQVVYGVETALKASA